MKRYLIEFCKNEDSSLEWIVWDTLVNESPTGWLESKEDAKRFLKQLEAL